MFGVHVHEEERRSLGEIAATATVAGIGIALVAAALVAILAPLDYWNRAVERGKLPTFEEKIEVRPPAREPPRRAVDNATLRR